MSTDLYAVSGTSPTEVKQTDCPAEAPQFKCPACPDVFPSKGKRRSHVQLTHGTSYFCAEHGLLFKDSMERDQHWTDVHGEASAPLATEQQAERYLHPESTINIPKENLGVVETLPSIPDIEPRQMSPEALHDLLRGHAVVFERMTRILPFVKEMKRRFDELVEKKGRQWLREHDWFGCRTWSEYCEKWLNRKPEYIRQLLKAASKAFPYDLPEKPEQSNLPLKTVKRNKHLVDAKVGDLVCVNGSGGTRPGRIIETDDEGITVQTGKTAKSIHKYPWDVDCGTIRSRTPQETINASRGDLLPTDLTLAVITNNSVRAIKGALVILKKHKAFDTDEEVQGCIQAIENALTNLKDLPADLERYDALEREAREGLPLDRFWKDDSTPPASPSQPTDTESERLNWQDMTAAEAIKNIIDRNERKFGRRSIIVPNQFKREDGTLTGPTNCRWQNLNNYILVYSAKYHDIGLAGISGNIREANPNDIHEMSDGLSDAIIAEYAEYDRILKDAMYQDARPDSTDPKLNESAYENMKNQMRKWADEPIVPVKATDKTQESSPAMPSALIGGEDDHRPVTYIPDLLTKQEADALFEACSKLPFKVRQNPRNPTNPKNVIQHQVVTFLTNKSARAAYVGPTFLMSEAPKEIKDVVDFLTEEWTDGRKVTYASVVRYRDQNDHMNYHQHREDKGRNTPVLVVSTGGVHPCGFRVAGKPETAEIIHPAHGSLYTMTNEANDTMQHAVLDSDTKTPVRYAINFKCIDDAYWTLDDKPAVFDCHSGKKYPPDAIYVGRETRDRKGKIIRPDTIFGNHQKLNEVAFRKYAAEKMQDPAFRAQVETLRGKHLLCWCGSKAKFCHAKVWLELANTR